MDKQQAAQIVRMLTVPHNIKPDAAMLNVWYQASLRDCEFDLALEIAADLNKVSNFMPKPAAFNELRRQRTSAERVLGLPETTEPPLPVDAQRAQLAKARAILESTTPPPSPFAKSGDDAA